MGVVCLGFGDNRLHKLAQLLGLGKSGGNALVLYKRASHIGEHGTAVSCLAAECVIAVSVSHGTLYWAFAKCSGWPGLFFVEFVLGYVHSEVQTFGLYQVFELGEGLLTKVAEFEQVILIE